MVCDASTGRTRGLEEIELNRKRKEKYKMMSSPLVSREVAALLSHIILPGDVSSQDRVESRWGVVVVSGQFSSLRGRETA
jgi:hypothetical protein